MDSLMKSGAFARLCRTTKETLRHYADIGLLRPAAVAPNGYKLYSLFQMTDFVMISSLQAAGLSLAEIAGVLGRRSNAQAHAALEAQVGHLERQIRDLERKKAFLENTLRQDATLRAWLDPSSREVNVTPEGNRWRLGFEREERFVATPTPYSEENERGFLAAVADHVDYCQAHGLPQRSQETYFIDAAAVASGDYRKGLHVATLVGNGVSSPRLHVKPAGTYLHWLNRIDLAQVERAPEGANPMFAAYDALLAFGRQKGLGLSGNVYDTEYTLFAGDGTSILFTEVSMLATQPAAMDGVPKGSGIAYAALAADDLQGALEAARLFHATVHAVNARDYAPEQLRAWAPDGKDFQRELAHRLMSQYAVTAKQGNVLAGFGSLDAPGCIDMLFVHKDHQRQGIGAGLLARLEEQAAALGQDAVSAYASLTARPFFERMGYRVVRANTAVRRGVPLANFLMRKELPRSRP